MEKLFPIGKVAMRVMRPVAKTFFKLQLPDKKDMNEIEKIYVNLCKLQELLKDRDICSIRLVTIPEKMVVEETKRSYMYLNLYNFNVDGLYINRILSDAVENEFFMEWKEIQGNYLEELTNVFQNIKTYRIKWYESDLNGLEYLERLCKDSLEDDEIFNVLKKDEGEVFKKLQEGYLLQVSVPFADKSQFQVYEGDREIKNKLGNFKRNIPLPEVISKYNLSKAKLEEGKLNITFSNK